LRGLIRAGPYRANDQKGMEGIMASQDIVIVSAARTAVGSFNGAFASVPAHA